METNENKMKDIINYLNLDEGVEQDVVLNAIKEKEETLNSQIEELKNNLEVSATEKEEIETYLSHNFTYCGIFSFRGQYLYICYAAGTTPRLVLLS